jgi:ABC-type antimicrobial peptide transport system permease subunit
LGGAPVLLAAGLVAGAALSLGLALGAAVRRHRRELAVLAALGFTSRDVGRTVVWQATTTMLVGLVIGVPVGIVVGRRLWSAFTTSSTCSTGPTFQC